MLEKFKAYIANNNLINGNNPILLGVSGGIDSAVLCKLFSLARIPFAIAHVNFGLRGGESDADSIFVSGLAEIYGVPFHKKYVDTKAIASEKGISTQMAAREIRYNWFKQLINKHNYESVAVGTHLNDQLETVILNFTKETGINGLTGIAPKRDFIIRPLLTFTRKEIESFAENNEVTYREDSSNEDVKYQRNRIRKNVIPQLKEINPALLKGFEKTLSHLQQVNAFIEDEVTKILADCSTQSDGKTIVQKEGIAKKHQRLVLHMWLFPFGFSSDQISKVSDAKIGARFCANRYVLSVQEKTITLTTEQKIPASIEITTAHSKVEWGKFKFELKQTTAPIQIENNKHIAYIDCDKLVGNIEIGSFIPGERIKPLGMQGSKKVSDVLTDAKIPLVEKAFTPIFRDELGPIWIPGIVISDRVKLGKSSEKIYLINAISNT